MSVVEIESAIQQLPPGELAKLARWFEEFHADAWDQQLEQDINAGNLDRLADDAISEFEAGNCREL